MEIQQQIENYISDLPQQKSSDMRILHRLILGIRPDCRLWFLDGKNSENKTVSNPSIGYGLRKIKYADGTSRDFYRIGISGNSTGISLYVLGIEDKTYLMRTYEDVIGRRV